MPPVAIQLYSLLFKLILRRRLSSLSASASSSSFGVSSRAAADHHHPSPPSNPSFSSAAGTDAVATKDLHPDPLSSLHLRLFLPNPHHSAAPAAAANAPPPLRRNSFPQPAHDAGSPAAAVGQELSRRASASFSGVSPSAAPCYGGYLPTARYGRRLPVIVQFHGGAFATGAADSAANDAFCRRVARLCDAIVVAVGYRLAPESRYPAAFEDGVTVLKWIAKQANLAACGRTMARGAGSGGADSFGAALVEPWLAAHADPSRCVLLGVSCGANIADYVARKAVEAGKLLDPIKLDWMKDRAIAYSEELRKVNVDAPVLEYKDAVHEFATLDVLLKTPLAQACAEDIAIWVKKYISLRGHELSY
uniref:Alpha/beta hydrolase fold-3 domain-containing protein n=1 Tax=Oryza rufipogon TaxID=4529 RepID=A0A0E0MX00_ORYRU